MKCYIFGIGGTGSRVQESIAHLLAAGCGYEQFKNWEFVFIILDLDDNNGNVLRTNKLLKAYQKIYSQLSMVDHGPLAHTFFRYKISKLREKKENFNISFNLAGRNTLRKFIQHDELSTESVMNTANNARQTLRSTKSLMDLLFSKEELDMSLEKGFKGHPNIGSIVFGELTRRRREGNVYSYENPDFKAFVDDFNPVQDRIFIINSIFGGTGAAGFPRLLKTLKDIKPESQVRPTIGTLTVKPYFKVTDNPQSHIDSKSFLAKTKAALTYYDDNLKEMNIAYYIGSEDMGKKFENKEGGEHQENNAHAVEFFAATALFDFLAHDRDGLQIPLADQQNDPNIFRYGLERDTDDQSVFYFKNISGDTSRWVFMPLIKYFLVKKIADIYNIKFDEERRFVSKHEGNFFSNVSWSQDTELVSKLGFFGGKVDPYLLKAPLYQDMCLFMNDFESWLRQMGDQGDRDAFSFLPFNPEINLGDRKVGDAKATSVQYILGGGTQLGETVKTVVDVKTKGNTTTVYYRNDFKNFNDLLQAMSQIVESKEYQALLKGVLKNASNVDNLRTVRFVELAYRSVDDIMRSISVSAKR